MQTCPEYANDPVTARSTARSRSASFSTMTAAFPELESDALAAGLLLQLPADARAPGEGDQLEAVVGDQLVREVGAAGGDVDHPGGHPGLDQDLAEEQRRERGRARRLEHERIS